MSIVLDDLLLNASNWTTRYSAVKSVAQTSKIQETCLRKSDAYERPPQLPFQINYIGVGRLRY